MNPAEFLADLISVDYSSAESVYSSQKRIDSLAESFLQQSSTILYASPLTSREGYKKSKLHKRTIVKKKGGWWRQFWLLLKRAWMQVGNSFNWYFIDLVSDPARKRKEDPPITLLDTRLDSSTSHSFAS